MYTDRWNQVVSVYAGGIDREMADKLGMTKQGFSNLKNSEGNPGTEVLKKLAAMGVNINWFLTGEGEMMVKVQNPDQELERLKQENEDLKKMVTSILAVAETAPPYLRIRKK